MTTSAHRPRNRRGEGGRLREDIVRAGAELLDEAGDEQAVTLRAVARRIGIAAPSIYAHFADRQAILLAVATEAFAELDERLRHARDVAPPEPVARLRAVCAAYLEFSRARPQRYRVMFGGVWNAARAVEEGGITEDQAAGMGQEALAQLVSGIQECVDAGLSTSTDAFADAIALWVGLHGLAHQRTAAPAFPWPPDLAERLTTSLAHL
jgi:AcrR family transcriptional regulator